MWRIVPLLVWWEVYTQGYTLLYHPGYTLLYHHLPVPVPLYTEPSSAVGESPGLSPGNNHGWEGSARLKVLNPVKVRGITLRVVTPLLPEELDERSDRCRVTPHVSPMRRDLCAEWSPVRSSDRC